MRYASPLIILILATTLSAQDAKKDLEKMQGEWKVVKAFSGGEEAPAKVVETTRFLIKDKSFKVSENGGDDDTGKIENLDPAAMPLTIDLSGPKGEDVCGLYKFEGDKLTMIFTMKGKANRPKEFKTVMGDGYRMVILERVKK